VRHKVDHGKTNKIRVDRMISQTCGLTRRGADRAIRAGELRINGAVVTDPGTHVDAGDRIELGGSAISWPVLRYFMLNKPDGVVCATRDRSHRTVIDLIDIDRKDLLHVAGRLDIDSTGLVLITDDGEWSHRVMHPRYKVPRSYLVTLDQPLSRSSCDQLLSGVRLHGEKRAFAALAIETRSEVKVSMTIAEGKYHQVKRMIAAVGNRVVQLHRQSIGKVELDPGLALGDFRPLTPVEIQAVIGSTIRSTT